MLPNGAASRFQCWNASMQYPAETARFWLSPSLPGLEAAFPCKLTSVSPARAALPQRQQKRCLGCAKVPKFALAALVVQHRFRRPKKALPTAFRGRLRSGNCFGYPSTFRDSKPHFPASLHRFRRRGWLCPEGNKSAAWEVRQIAPALRHGSCASAKFDKPQKGLRMPRFGI